MELGIVSLFIGQKILTDTISNTTSNIYTILGKPSFNSISYDKFLFQLDIKQKLRTIESVLKNITDNNDTIHIMLTGIHDIIIIIHEDLQKIDNKVTNHSKKWFSYYRSYDIDDLINDLKIHVMILDNRYDLFIKTIKCL